MRFARTAAWAVAALAALWAADVGLQSIPVRYSSESSGIPAVHSRAEAAAFVRRALLPYGGMPGDAALAQGGSEQMVMQPDATFPSGVRQQDEYFFRWEPRGTIAGPDAIVAIVDDAPLRRCVDASCSHYQIRYALHLDFLHRVWRPAFARAIADWRMRRDAPLAPAPDSVQANCGPGRLQMDALRRVIGSVNLYDPYMHIGPDPKPAVRELSALARFKPYLLDLHDGRPPAMHVRAAWVSDALYQGSRRGIEMEVQWLHPPIPKPPPNIPKYKYFATWSRYRWVHFAGADTEPMCVGAPRVAAIREEARRPRDLAANARYRLWDEIENAERFRVKPATNPAIAVVRSSNGSAVTIDWPTNRGTWHARYNYDSNGELSSVDVRMPD